MEWITIEDMINEGSISALQALKMGYQWNSVVIGGDALSLRKRWLESQVNK